MKTMTLVCLLAVAAILVAACGGGGGGGGGSTAVVSTGVVSSISSISMNGTTFSCVGARLVDDDDNTLDQGSGDRCVNAQNAGKLAPGMVVTVEGTSNGTTGTATKIKVRKELKGPVDSVDVANNSFVVLGQKVLVDDQTKFDISTGADPDDLSDISVGMFLEVHGLRDGNGNILATFIEDKNMNMASEFEVKGIADVTNGVITVGGLTILVGNFPSPAIADGQCVELHGNLTAPNTLTLSRAANIDDDCEGLPENTGFAEIEGIVNGFTAPDQEFNVGTQRVILGPNVTFRNGTVDDLIDGAKVEVEGAIANGLLTANKVKIKPGVRMRAVIDTVGANTLSVLGITVNLNANTRIDDQPVAGQQFEIRGFKTGAASITATRVRARSGGNNDTELRGPVDAGSITSPSFKILGVQVNTTSSTEFNDGAATQDSFFAGLAANEIVKAKGAENPDNQIAAREVEDEED